MGQGNRDAVEKAEGVEDTLTELLRTSAQRPIRQPAEAELPNVWPGHAHRTCGQWLREGAAQGLSPPSARGHRGRPRLPAGAKGAEYLVTFRSILVQTYVRRTRTLDAVLLCST